MMNEARWDRRRPKAATAAGKAFPLTKRQLDKGDGLCYKNLILFQVVEKKYLFIYYLGIDKTITHDISFNQ